jgi:hypothetical protein
MRTQNPRPHDRVASVASSGLFAFKCDRLQQRHVVMGGVALRDGFHEPPMSTAHEHIHLLEVFVIA